MGFVNVYGLLNLLGIVSLFREVREDEIYRLIVLFVGIVFLEYIRSVVFSLNVTRLCRIL